jgi:hypothetical protein
MITRRCTQRQFLLRPDAETNATFLYCLAEAAQRFEIDVILPCALSNHHHTIVFDRHGRVVEFAAHLHKFIAKAMNALRRRRENFWSSEPMCLVYLLEPSDVLNKLVYTATNPVKDGLVQRAHQWPGVNGLAALLNQRILTIPRPRHFFRVRGRMPAVATLSLAFPPELGDAAQLRRALRDEVDAVERNVAQARARAGSRVLGRRAVLEQLWRQHPEPREPSTGITPRLAARSGWARVEALQRDRIFVSAYRAARLRWRAGAEAVFPVGTYWLCRFANVPISTSA